MNIKKKFQNSFMAIIVTIAIILYAALCYYLVEQLFNSRNVSIGLCITSILILLVSLYKDLGRTTTKELYEIPSKTEGNSRTVYPDGNQKTKLGTA